ncbi:MULTISPECIES: DUF5682 family protein [Streptomycetaceae]|uniref:Uncharacterized protein n=1 Tax=Streptantibioticus cattleyicolor (strain ATCC 35852 / DSM 46488 / JCM 4925 / NBRC 14057 / NRRL 8057) TaxID=1003195 RepID=F8K074_STREN|nr:MULTISPECIES: DUF5682 family protein [Streptomycetaceae]AEW96059.1 hypothetical protein SCATT_36880 [Streptantibioticus cattleyicolor NRRL 8057 = DSM 46488]MYS60589.1 hypothetical protein [Streptomyces sp. SID5468]CCB76394.1 conserved protein of unknown function [Streptantibioticus cattleyicolor NRRL 8057 = DSM 46488]
MTARTRPADPPPAPAGSPLLLGVRHHGPGSARGVRAALERHRPAVVLVEGPREADAVVELAGAEGMRPPVALLAHAVDDPAVAAFWPFAEFSPEWQAIRWAVERRVPVRFIDLPAAHTLALRQAPPEEDGVRADPLAVLARTAGYDDPERWWEDAVEHRAGDGDVTAAFAAVAEAMTVLRGSPGEGDPGGVEAAREAHMRLRIREAVREFGHAAVVCGAWHVPALARARPVTADRQAVRGLPKVRAAITWVPWTHRRLTRSSGYGAGIDSPGWYAHLFRHAGREPGAVLAGWLTTVAGLLREEDLPVSTAHVIEAVRLAETLAALRGRPLAGLAESLDAARAVLCEGSEVPLALVRERLVVGEALGQVPPEAPAVPLARDLARLQRALRLRPEAAERRLDLDLRNDTDARRSRLLHRLALLGVDWGHPDTSRTGGTGTFRESWRLRWEPESAVRVAEAGVWGTTVRAAATAKTQDAAGSAATLAEVTALAERCLPAGLPEALRTVTRALADKAALDTDVSQLAQALPALVRSVRYGDVRDTDAAALREVAEGIALRVCVGLPPACAGLDESGATVMRGHLDAVHAAVGLLGGAGPGERWAATLGVLARRDAAVSGLIRGRAVRLLLDDGRLTAPEAERLMALALSPGTPHRDAAALIDGFLADGGMLLVHDERLLGLVDRWLTAVPKEAFTDVLPLVRRTFGRFEAGVRRSVGELVRRGTGGGAARAAGPAEGLPGFAPELDAARADAVLPVLRLLLGHREEGVTA